MYAAAYLSGGKKARKNIEVGIDHFSFGIDSESAHAVVTRGQRRQAKKVPLLTSVSSKIFALKFGIGLFRDGVIPTLNAFFEQLGVNAVA